MVFSGTLGSSSRDAVQRRFKATVRDMEDTNTEKYAALELIVALSDQNWQNIFSHTNCCVLTAQVCCTYRPHI